MHWLMPDETRKAASAPGPALFLCGLAGNIPLNFKRTEKKLFNSTMFILLKDHIEDSFVFTSHKNLQILCLSCQRDPQLPALRLHCRQQILHNIPNHEVLVRHSACWIQIPPAFLAAGTCGIFFRMPEPSRQDRIQERSSGKRRDQIKSLSLGKSINCHSCPGGIGLS